MPRSTLSGHYCIILGLVAGLALGAILGGILSLYSTSRDRDPELDCERHGYWIFAPSPGCLLVASSADPGALIGLHTSSTLVSRVSHDLLQRVGATAAWIAFTRYASPLVER